MKLMPRLRKIVFKGFTSPLTTMLRGMLEWRARFADDEDRSLLLWYPSFRYFAWQVCHPLLHYNATLAYRIFCDVGEEIATAIERKRLHEQQS